MKRLPILGGMFLGAALLAPGALSAQERSTTTTTTTTETKRYYDSVERKDRTWDDQEERAYRMYLQEQHRDYVEFPKVKTTERTEYFKWRHKHPNSVIIKSETTEEKH